MNQWITQDDIKPHRFYIDADAAYEAVMPDVLAALDREALRVARVNTPEGNDVPEIEPAVIDQYTLEVAHNWIKLDAQMQVNVNFTLPDPNVVREHIIRGSEGYKDRWGWRAHPPGKYAELREQDENRFAVVVAKEAKALYKATRGYLPQ